MSRPLFSCVMPVKGKRPFIDEALASLEAQGMGEDLEVIIQDGDAEPDCGQSDALNKGFAKARGEWFFWLNADDVLLSGALEKVRSLIQSTTPPCALNWIAGNVAYLDELGQVTRCAWDLGRQYSYRQMPVQVYGPSSFFRRELFKKFVSFDVTLHYVMDVDMWCRFREAGYWYEKLPDLVWGFRVHSGSKTHEAQAGGWPKEMASEHRVLDARYSIKERGIDRRLAQLSRFLNGSYFRSFTLTRRYKGHDWKTL